jgi:predicted N-acyltransferase
LPTIELSTHESIRDIPEDEWAALTGEDTPPFLTWTFLDVLERTGCVDPRKGWAPSHITLRREGRLVAAAPAYTKENSEGEFVFDHGWANFAEGRLGIAYYPKLVVAVPFTPATGPRLLVRDGEDEAQLLGVLAGGLQHLVGSGSVSGAHVLFPPEQQTSVLVSRGLAHRLGLQYHWRNDGYASFDDFLGRFNSKRRHQIRREVRAPAEQGLVLETRTGRDLDAALVDRVYDFYVSTVNKYYWGRQYLNRAFFEELCARLPSAVLVVLARETASKRVIAGAFNLLGKQALYGRYWGADEERPFLHFNVCYYRGIGECIERGLPLFEPGAGGEHKLARGFEPTVTHSAHHLGDPRLDRAVRDFLDRERAAVRQHMDAYLREPVIRPRS